MKKQRESKGLWTVEVSFKHEPNKEEIRVWRALGQGESLPYGGIKEQCGFKVVMTLRLLKTNISLFGLLIRINDSVSELIS